MRAMRKAGVLDAIQKISGLPGVPSFCATQGLREPLSHGRDVVKRTGNGAHNIV